MEPERNPVTDRERRLVSLVRRARGFVDGILDVLPCDAEVRDDLRRWKREVKELGV